MPDKIKNLRVRRANIKDIHDILKTEKECGLSEWSFEDYRKEIGRDNSLVIVAEIKNKVFGL